MTSFCPRFVLAALVLFLWGSHTASAQDQADTPNLAGRYECRGTSTGGQVYRGEVNITRQGRGYRLDWTIGRQEYNGIGFIEEGRLVVSWLIVDQGQVSHGVGSYQINKNGILEGKWTDPLARDIYTEILTPMNKTI